MKHRFFTSVALGAALFSTSNHAFTAAAAAQDASCVRATELWSDDFESGDHSRWTGQSYSDDWGDGCQSTRIVTDVAHGGRYAQRSEIVCPSSSPEGVHRGYGGLQMDEQARVLPKHTNQGQGLDAPYGIVTTFWTRLDVPYSFGEGRWMSLFTVNPSCDYTDRVVTLGIDDADGILRAAHYWPEGTQTIEPDAPAFPMGEWVRVTVYLNLHTGDMHVWQNGQSVLHVDGIDRRLTTMCQWHWGLYASADNTDVVMYEDDKVVWRLDQRYEDWSREPLLGASTMPVCE